MINNQLLRPKEAARYLRVSYSTLARWRGSGEGPKFSKAGPRVIVYERTNLDDWIASRSGSSTAAYQNFEGFK